MFQFIPLLQAFLSVWSIMFQFYFILLLLWREISIYRYRDIFSVPTSKFYLKNIKKSFYTPSLLLIEGLNKD